MRHEGERSHCYDPLWPQRLTAESNPLRQTLGSIVIAPHHIGITAVPGLATKPIVDTLSEVRTWHLWEIPETTPGFGGNSFDREKTRATHFEAVHRVEQSCMERSHAIASKGGQGEMG
ncbi:MAG: GrpB family protein [Gammaproteobacteria bacterium]|nr:GrpB family protein [Gammaproteobacteria bacterium]